jgi:hypothetical protein
VPNGIIVLSNRLVAEIWQIEAGFRVAESSLLLFLYIPEMKSVQKNFLCFAYYAVFHADDSVGLGGKFLVVGYDD